MLDCPEQTHTFPISTSVKVLVPDFASPLNSRPSALADID
jgi:hypothetical protein